MSGPLVIVESPTKAKKITEFLSDLADGGRRPHRSSASVGHIRDLPAKASQLPAAGQKQWCRTSASIRMRVSFPIYIAHDTKKSVVALISSDSSRTPILLLPRHR